MAQIGGHKDELLSPPWTHDGGHCMVEDPSVELLETSFVSQLKEWIFKNAIRLGIKVAEHIILCSTGMANYGEDSSQIDISVEEKDKLVAEVIRTVLFKMHQSSGCPIKRDELTHLITKNYRQRSLPGFIINEAKNKLASIFGYEMKELQRCRPSSAKQGRSSQQSLGELKSYIIVSKLPADIYCKYVENKENSHITGFTFAVVSVVHLAGGKISEENLWHHLRRLGLSENDENHPLFGHVKQALELLVQQRYLQKAKGNGPEGNILMYELAERALDESFNEKLKDYIAQIANKDAATAEVDD